MSERLQGFSYKFQRSSGSSDRWRLGDCKDLVAGMCLSNDQEHCGSVNETASRKVGVLEYCSDLPQWGFENNGIIGKSSHCSEAIEGAVQWDCIVNDNNGCNCYSSWSNVRTSIK